MLEFRSDLIVLCALTLALQVDFRARPGSVSLFVREGFDVLASSTLSSRHQNE